MRNAECGILNEWIADLAFLVGRLKIDQSAIDN